MKNLNIYRIVEEGATVIKKLIGSKIGDSKRACSVLGLPSPCTEIVPYEIQIEDIPKLTLLLQEEADKHSKKQLEVLKKYGNKAAMSDLALVRGGKYSEEDLVPDLEEGQARTCAYCTISGKKKVEASAINDIGGTDDFVYNTREISVRPVLESSFIFNFVHNRRKKGYNGVEEVTFGEYPQYAPEYKKQLEIEKFYQYGLLVKTGRTYTFDRSKVKNKSQEFQPVTYDEYEYNNGYEVKRYVRVKANLFHGYDEKTEGRAIARPEHYLSTTQTLSTGDATKCGYYVWLEVKPVTWLIDEQKQRLISKIALLSGIRFSGERYSSRFEDTDMYQFLNQHMLRDILQSEELFLSQIQDAIIETNQKVKTR